MKKVRVGRSDVFVPAIGQGTWFMGENEDAFSQEVEALRAGIEAGLTLIDTAEMYAQGGAEKVVAKAIEDCRSDVFLVTKVWPTNGSYEGILNSAKQSLKRLQTDVIDLYLLHWPSKQYPISESMRAMQTLINDGLIRFAGVSNFDVNLMQEAQEALGEHALTSNQVPFHLEQRVIEHDILPYCVENDIMVMAYSPFGGQGRFPAPGTDGRNLLDQIAAKYDATPHQIVLAWNISHQNVIAIPKSSRASRAQENARALTIELSPEDIEAINKQFPLSDNRLEVVRH